MNDNVHRISLGLITAGLGGAGALKLADTDFTRENFARWGYPDPARFVIGAIEVGVAASAVSAARTPVARPVAAVGTLCSMACALATHARAGDSAPNYIAPVVLTGAAITLLVA